MRTFICIIILAVLAAGCGRKATTIGTGKEVGDEAPASKKPADLIVGKWEPTEPAPALEFFKDGTVEMVPLAKGKYQFKDEDVVEWDFGLKGLSTRVKVKVTPEEMEVTTLEGEKKGKVTAFKRVNEFSEQFKGVARPAPAPSASTAKLKDVLTFKDHEGPVNAVCFSTDGELVASGGDDKVVKVWKRGTGEVVATLTGHRRNIEGLAWSPRGDLLASAGGGTKLWDTKAWKEIPTLINGKQSMGRFLQFSPDGTRLIATGNFKEGDDYAQWEQGVRVWDLDKNTKVRDISKSDSWIMALAVSPDGRHIATTHGDNTAMVVEIETGKVAFRRKQNQTRSITFSPDGKTLAVGWNGAELLDWGQGSEAKGRNVKTKGSPNHIEFLSSRNLATSFSYRSSGPGGMTNQIGMQVIDSEKSEPIAEGGGHSADIQAMAVSDDGKWLATGGNDSLVKVWNISAYGNRRPRLVPMSPKPAVTTDDKPKDDPKTDSPPLEPKKAEAFDQVRSENPLILKDHIGKVASIAFSPDTDRMATFARDEADPSWSKGEVTIWNLGAEKAERKIPCPSYFRPLTFSPDGTSICLGSQVCDVATGKEKNTYSSQPSYLSYTPDGKTLVMVGGSLSETVKVWAWDVATGKEVRPTIHIQPPSSGKEDRIAALSRDGGLVVIAPTSIEAFDEREGKQKSREKWTIGIWSCDTGGLKYALDIPVGNSTSCNALAFDPSGQQVAIVLNGTKTGKVILWHTQKGTNRSLLEGDRISDVSFSVEGNRLLALEGKKVRVVDTITGKGVLTLSVAASPTPKSWRSIEESPSFSAFSPDGKYMVVAYGVTAQVWERKGGASKVVTKVPAIKAIPEEKKEERKDPDRDKDDRPIKKEEPKPLEPKKVDDRRPLEPKPPEPKKVDDIRPLEPKKVGD